MRPSRGAAAKASAAYQMLLPRAKRAAAEAQEASGGPPVAPTEDQHHNAGGSRAKAKRPKVARPRGPEQSGHVDAASLFSTQAKQTLEAVVSEDTASR